jgi:two-component system, OmpR family, sensor kinase
MKRLYFRVLLALLPLLVGVGIYLVLHTAFAPVAVLVFKADFGSALVVTCALLSVILLAWVIGSLQAERRGRYAISEERTFAEDARRRFLRRLDHELKNPLTGLRAALANLSGDPPGSAGLEQRALGDARRQVERLSRLVADLRKLAELEEIPLEMVPVDLGEVLEESVQAARELPQYREREVRVLISKVPWPLPNVTGDRDLLGLAFYNLVENALKYSAPGDAVEVRAVEDGRWVVVDIADSGPGIAGEDLPRVFEELYRGANARGLEGSGLGLALVRRVIERHGGEVSVRSRQDGQKGTVFQVRLPGVRTR